MHWGMQVMLTDIFQNLVFIKYNLDKQNSQERNMVQYKFTCNHAFFS